MSRCGLSIRSLSRNSVEMTAILSIVVVLWYLSFAAADNNCVNDPQNNCKANCNGTMLDITNLVTYPFKITLDHKNQKGIGNYFMYDPCNGIKCDEEDGTSVCLTTSSGDTTCGFGSLWQIISTNPLKFTVLYMCQEGSACVSTSLFTFNQNDDEDVKITFNKKDKDGFEFDVTGKCIGNCDEAPTTHNGNHEDAAQLTGIAGLVLIIVFFAAILTYFIAGALIMKFRKGASGKEVIPNYEFWFALPFYVKDGCLFATKPCYKKLKKDKGYSAIP